MTDYEKLEQMLIKQLEEAKQRYELEAKPIIAKLIELRNLAPLTPIYVSLIDGKLSN